MHEKDRRKFLSHARISGTVLTAAETRQLEKDGAAMPRGFTGIWKGVLYFKGLRWEGPTNAMGVRS